MCVREIAYGTYTYKEISISVAVFV
jgi:hypothetical protein